MTTPEIKTDPASIADAVAALKDQATTVGTAADDAAAAVASAAAKPAPAGARPSPALAAVAAETPNLLDALRGAERRINGASKTLSDWHGGVGEIDSRGAAEVAAQGGGGGSW